MAAPNTRELYNHRRGALWEERSSWISQWQEVSENLLPRNGRFLVSDRNRGDKRHNLIYDNTGTRALRVLGAGLMAGMTSPARPWFRLTTPDPKLAENDEVKGWLDDVTRLMRTIFAKGNTYRTLHSLYEEIGAFGTGAALLLPDYNDVLHAAPLTIGEYAIATNYKGEVDTVYREFDMTVSQVVREFGIENCSKYIKDLFDKGKGLDKWVTITHVVEPRNVRDLKGKLPKDMAYASCYFESKGSEEKMLRESGFKRFRAIAPRWAVSGGDVYGNSPGMEALGDLKQLQHQQYRKLQGIDYQTKPPMQAPASLKNQETNLLPGGVTYVDLTNANSGLRPAFEANINLQHLLLDIQDTRERVRQTFYADLFMMLSNDDRSGITAREVAERHEEKLLMLGPVLERMFNEMLSPLIDVTFDEMLTAKIVPPPPKALHGQDLEIEFVSVLAQAQRAVGIQSVDRLLGTVASLAGAKQDPGIWDKIDTDQVIDNYADMLGVDPAMIVGDEKVALVRGERAKAQAQQQQAMAAEQSARTAQTLAKAPTDGQNALTDIMSGLQGYGGQF
ncbi:MAG: hypothetical protein KAX46_00065 [Chromatiaceae bacterium]|nr:hypothetical protein [Chromatiaceae bacterium]